MYNRVVCSTMSVSAIPKMILQGSRITGLVTTNMMLYYGVHIDEKITGKPLTMEYMGPLFAAHVNLSLIGYVVGPVLPFITIPYAILYSNKKRIEEEQRKKQHLH